MSKLLVVGAYRSVPRATCSHTRAAWTIANVRSLSTSKKEFLCLMPDKPNVSELRKRVKG